MKQIVVSARKRAEPLQQTPVAVTALTGESLERVYATDLADLNGRAPNVTIETVSSFSTSASVFMRGVVIEIPRPRWSTVDAAHFGVELPPEIPRTVQDRAYTSPIWYTP